VLVEGPSRRGDELMGRTRTDKTVVFAGPSELVGQLVQVRIEAAWAHTLKGVVDCETTETRRHGGNTEKVGLY